MTGQAHFPARSTRWLRQGLEGMLLVAAATIVARLAEGHLGIANLALFYLLPVMVQSGRAGLWAGLFTSVTAALAFNFFLVPPHYTLHVADTDNLVTMLVLFAVALAVSELAARLRQQAERAERLASINARLAAFSERMAGLGDTAAVLPALERVLAAELELRTRLIEGLEDEHSPAGLSGLDVAAARWAATHKERTGRGTTIMSGADWLFVPLAAPAPANLVLAVAREDAAIPIDREVQPLFDGMIDRTEHALARAAVGAEQAAIEQGRQREQLREALLSSISHDLRTPLTAIRTGLEALICAPGQRASVDAVKAETARLERLVSNLLEMARIEAGATPVAHQVIDLTDTIAAVVETLPPDQHDAISVVLPPDLPLVRSDARMLHHMLLNLVENAIRHGGGAEGVTIAAERDGDELLLTVDDRGPGIPPGQEDMIFERFNRVDRSNRAGGAGLGLAIVRGFGNALGLTVTAANRPDAKGATFSIRFGPAQLIAARQHTTL